MSELKATTVYDAYWKAASNGDSSILVYLKSEADKVIADKDAEIAQLQAMLEGRNKQVWALKHRIAPKQSDKTLQERFNEVCEKHGVSTLQDLDWAFCESEKRRTKDNINAVNIIYHHKYKRCLAMARWCLTERVYFHYRYDDWGDKGYDRPYKWKKVVFWGKWARRWLKIAEEFKEGV